MTLYDAIQSGKPFRRKHWPNPNFIGCDDDLTDWGLGRKDIVATDWEIKEDPPTQIWFPDGDYTVVIEKYGDSVSISNGYTDITFTEERVDQLLAFLYHNSDIGKKRIIPF